MGRGSGFDVNSCDANAICVIVPDRRERTLGVDLLVSTARLKIRMKCRWRRDLIQSDIDWLLSLKTIVIVLLVAEAKSCKDKCR
jgi:hypothetical protein